jgi:uncharacterized protein YidB (DUF937 family)
MRRQNLQCSNDTMIIDGTGQPDGRLAFALKQEVPNMGLLDGLLGGAVGAEMVTVVNGFIEKHGGVQGIVAQMEQQGLGGTVRSWVGTGANQPITEDQIHQAFGSDTVKQLAAKVGLTPQELAAKLSTILPQAIDKLTPGGTVAKI